MADDLEQLRAAHPNRHIEFSRTGDTHGRWDGTRLKPVVRNLVSNADKYGAADTPIRVTILGEVSDVGLEVSNSAGEEPIDRFTGNCPPSSRASRIPKTTTLRAASAWGCSSWVRSWMHTAARSKCAPRPERPLSPCTCRVRNRPPLPERPRGTDGCLQAIRRRSPAYAVAAWRMPSTYAVGWKPKASLNLPESNT